MKEFIEKLNNKLNLSFEESKNAFKILMEGKASDQEIYDFLTLLSSKGETSDEIAGGVHVLREKSKRVNIKEKLKIILFLLNLKIAKNNPKIIPNSRESKVSLIVNKEAVSSSGNFSIIKFIL